MLSLRTIVPDTLELLKTLFQSPLFKDMRLVGGTSLALQYGHRQSIDLDFFTHEEVDQDKIISELRIFGDVYIKNKTKTILQVVINGINVDVVQYTNYDWIDAPIIESGISLASDKDIAAMKVNAIIGRGSKKDFIDLYVLLQHYSLEEILNFYRKKYPDYSDYRALLSLSYFEDAEPQDMPTMFIPETWMEMKRYIQLQVTEYQK